MKPIHFEYQRLNEFTVVALDAQLSDFNPKPILENGKPVMRVPAKTVKDCRNIDGCIYYHLGYATDSEMIDLIEKFQKLLFEKGWKKKPATFTNEIDFIGSAE